MIFNYFLAFDLLTLTYGRDNFLGGDENQFWQSTQRVPPLPTLVSTHNELLQPSRPSPNLVK